MIKDLAKEIKNKQVLLFAGAGVSMNLKLPSWKKLIDHIAEELGYDREVFKILGNNNYLDLAEFYKLSKGSFGPLRSWMDVEWNKGKEKIQTSKVHKSIVNLDFPIIYTTNYDRMLEYSYDLFKDENSYIKISDISDLKNIKENTTQIVKLHGDLDREENLVLAESDYFKRLSFNNPLDIKLRSDLLAKSVLFVGYGLNDINIRYMLFQLIEMWRDSIKEDQMPKSYIFSNSINEIQKKILKAKGVQVLSNMEDEPGRALEKFLKELQDLQ